MHLLKQSDEWEVRTDLFRRPFAWEQPGDHAVEKDGKWHKDSAADAAMRLPNHLRIAAAPCPRPNHLPAQYRTTVG